MTTYTLNAEELHKMFANQKDGVLLCNSLTGNISLYAPSPKKNYWKYGNFAFAKETFDNLQEMMDEYIPYLLLIPKKGFEANHEARYQKIKALCDAAEEGKQT